MLERLLKARNAYPMFKDKGAPKICFRSAAIALYNQLNGLALFVPRFTSNILDKKKLLAINRLGLQNMVEYDRRLQQPEGRLTEGESKQEFSDVLSKIEKLIDMFEGEIPLLEQDILDVNRYCPQARAAAAADEDEEDEQGDDEDDEDYEDEDDEDEDVEYCINEKGQRKPKPKDIPGYTWVCLPRKDGYPWVKVKNVPTVANASASVDEIIDAFLARKGLGARELGACG